MATAENNLPVDIYAYDYRPYFARPPPSRIADDCGSSIHLPDLAGDLGRVRRASPYLDDVAPRTTSGLADDVLGLGDDALGGSTASQRRSVQSRQTNIAEHEAKLTAYIDNPYAYDSLGHLANAPSGGVRQSIIQGRVRHLENEMTTFADQIRKLTGGG